MKNQSKLSSLIGALLIVSGILLFVIMFVPMWRIDLDAPQYPEGLRLLIYSNKLGGNVDIINGLNHYIGMKTLHTEDFIEFKVLPYIISFFGIFFILTGVLRNRKMLYTLFALFVSFGIIAMADFWKWEYDYGHNLSPDAAIIVPGMAYQPPLIGFKQLLNFGAYSIPDIGGWLFIVAGATALFCIIIDHRSYKLSKAIKPVLTLLFISLSFCSCSISPQPLKIGVDNCAFCKMTISNPRFGAEILTKKGKAFKYDDISCLVADLKQNSVTSENINAIYSVDFSSSHQLVDVKECLFLESENLRSPMGSNIASVSNKDTLNFYLNNLQAQEISWSEIIKQ
jgi:copper chaperone NosL